MGQILPLEQADALGESPLLRHVQPHQARLVGVRQPGDRLLPAQVRLDTDCPAPDGRRDGVSGRLGPDRLLDRTPPPQQTPTGPKHAAPVAGTARPMLDLPGAAAAHRPRAPKPTTVGTMAPGPPPQKPHTTR